MKGKLLIKKPLFSQNKYIFRYIFKNKKPHNAMPSQVNLAKADIPLTLFKENTHTSTKKLTECVISVPYKNFHENGKNGVWTVGTCFRHGNGVQY